MKKVEYSNPWFRVVSDKGYHWVEEPGSVHGAAVLPIVNEQVLLLRHQRPSQGGAITWEIPRGYANPGESPAACARRELAEETGLHVDENEFTWLGKVRPNTAILASHINLYLISLADKPELHERDEEALALAWMPLKALPEWLAAGKLEDSFTLAALAYYQLRR